MKILYIATQVEVINSSAAIRNSALIKGLGELGHDIHVETIDYPSQYISGFLAKNLPVASIHRTQLSVYRFNQTVKSGRVARSSYRLRRILKKIRDVVYFPDISVSWIECFDYTSLQKDYDLIISSSDSKVSHLLAEKICEILDVPWIQVWGDPWYNDFTNLKLNRLRAYRHERRLVSKADKVIYVSEATLHKQASIFSAYADKMQFVPRGFFISQESENRIRDNRIVISYTGNLFWGRNISALLEALRNHNAKSHHRFVLNVYGAQDEDVIENIKDYDFVNAFPPVDYEQILSVYESSNMLLFISNSSESTQIPGKFFDYSGTTKPILCLMDNDECEIADYLRLHDRCLVLNNDRDVIAENMDVIFARSSETYSIEPSFHPKEVARQILR